MACRRPAVRARLGPSPEPLRGLEPHPERGRPLRSLGGAVPLRQAGDLAALLVAITLFVFVAFYVTPANRRPAELTNNTYRIHGSLAHHYALFAATCR